MNAMKFKFETFDFHGALMPLPVRSRRYDEEFWKELMGGKEKKSEAQLKKEMRFQN